LSAGGRTPSVGAPDGISPVVVAGVSGADVGRGGSAVQPATRTTTAKVSPTFRYFITSIVPHSVGDAGVTSSEPKLAKVGRSHAREADAGVLGAEER